MRGSGIRFDTGKLQRDIKKLGKSLRADKFTPELLNYTRVSLNTCIKTTPSRDLSTIQTSQRGQYASRIGYIPSVHTLEDPTLIVKPDGTNMLYCGGKWYRPAMWQLPSDVYAVYQQLLAEQLRRTEKSQQEFIAERTPARMLYKKSWLQCGESLGLKLIATAAVRNAFSRRKPKKEPAKGYAQLRGGKEVISVVIYNPFIDDDSSYRTFDGDQILSDALDKHRPAFLNSVRKKVERILYAMARA